MVTAVKIKGVEMKGIDEPLKRQTLLLICRKKKPHHESQTSSRIAPYCLTTSDEDKRRNP